MKLYHKDVYFRPTFEPICYEMLSTRPIVITQHTKTRIETRHINADKVNKIIEFIKQNCDRYELFEVKSNRYIQEFALRTSYNKYNDICLVFANNYDKRLKQPYLALKTIWINSKDDAHETLNVKKYEIAY